MQKMLNQKQTTGPGLLSPKAEVYGELLLEGNKTFIEVE